LGKKISIGGREGRGERGEGRGDRTTYIPLKVATATRTRNEKRIPTGLTI
jgi:hypothetical protein